MELEIQESYEPIVIENETQLPMVQNEETMPDITKNLAQDIANARDNIYELIDKGKEGLDIALNIVQSSESPRAIEVFSTLIKTLTDVNMQLIDIHKKAEPSVKKEEIETIKQQTINQTAIFAGTTAELAKLLNGMKNE